MVLVSQRTSTIRRGSVQTVLTRFNNVNSLYIFIPGDVFYVLVHVLLSDNILSSFVCEQQASVFFF